MSKDDEVREKALPEGRVINSSLFARDIYKDAVTGKEGFPSYKIELAFDPDDVEGEGTIEDHLIDAAIEAWGDGAEDDFLDGKIRSPLLDGDKLAARREKNGKPGDAYKGKKVIRAHTKFNKHGEDGPGGIQVWDETVEEITPAQQEQIYAGCFGIAAVTIGTYMDKDRDGEEVPSLMFYLSAFQKTKEGERLVTPKDTSSLFKPVGRTKGEGTSKRRSRKG